MGTKLDIVTVEGMRTQAHTSIDAFFNSLVRDADGCPVDEVEVRGEKEIDGTGRGGAGINRGMVFGVRVLYRTPEIVCAGEELHLELRLSEDNKRTEVYRLIEQSDAKVNALAQFLLAQGHVHDVEDILGEMMDKRPLKVDITISDLTRLTNMFYETLPEPEVDDEVHEEVDLPGDEEESEEDKETLADKIAGIRSKAAAMEFAKEHSVILIEDSKLAEMKDTLHATLVDGKPQTVSSPQSTAETEGAGEGDKPPEQT